MLIELTVAIILIGVWFVIGLLPYLIMGGQR
jgi:type II secretory pathway pseudopilin PulG